MGFVNRFFLSGDPECSNILWDRLLQRLKKPFQQELWMNVGYDQPLPSTPLLDMVRYVGGFVLAEGRQKFYVDIVTNQKLEVVKED